jgi:hypothetical protein
MFVCEAVTGQRLRCICLLRDRCLAAGAVYRVITEQRVYMLHHTSSCTPYSTLPPN